ncbi:hypothetical protein BJY52DRAFT_1227795 [Lactarius psammicola]|nr:hypothetical protein BJY52DRAFT_1227795 [Lactarius psammicola]
MCRKAVREFKTTHQPMKSPTLEASIAEGRKHLAGRYINNPDAYAVQLDDDGDVESVDGRTVRDLGGIERLHSATEVCVVADGSARKRVEWGVGGECCFQAWGYLGGRMCWVALLGSSRWTSQMRGVRSTRSGAAAFSVLSSPFCVYPLLTHFYLPPAHSGSSELWGALPCSRAYTQGARSTRSLAITLRCRLGRRDGYGTEREMQAAQLDDDGRTKPVIDGSCVSQGTVGEEVVGGGGGSAASVALGRGGTLRANVLCGAARPATCGNVASPSLPMLRLWSISRLKIYDDPDMSKTQSLIPK